MRSSTGAVRPRLLTANFAIICAATLAFYASLYMQVPLFPDFLRNRAHAADAGLVICGHSHVPFVGRDRDLTVFNPGSIGPRRFHLPIVFGVLELAAGRITLKHVDCETGEQWLP